MFNKWQSQGCHTNFNIMIGAIIGAVGSLIAGAIGGAANASSTKNTNRTNLQISQETNQANRDIADSVNETNKYLAQKQNEWNLEQWNRENEYNHPAMQAQRFRMAGLSAAAAAQGASNVPAPHLQSANLANQQMGAPMQAATMQAPQFNFAETAKALVETLGGAANASKSVKEANLMNDLIMTDLDAKRWATQLTMQQYFQNQLSFPHQNRLLQYQADSAYWRSKGDAYFPENMRMAYMLQKQTFEQSEYTFKNVTPLSIEKLGNEIHNLIEEGKNLRAQRENINANTANIIADTENKKAQNGLIEAQTLNVEEDTNVKKQEGFFKRIQNAYGIAGMPNDAAGRVAALVANGVITPQQSIDIVKHGLQYIKTSGKVFDLSPDLKQFYNYTINPSAFELYKNQSHYKTALDDYERMLPDFGKLISEKRDKFVEDSWKDVKY